MSETVTGVTGVWLAYYADGSAFAIFREEIEALRFAVEFSMQVKFVQWGRIEI